jgi:hypothetical protein
MGRGAYITAQVEHNRTESRIMNKIQYVKQSAQAMFGASYDYVNLEGVQVHMVDEAGQQRRFFPPQGEKGAHSDTVGFLNINTIAAGLATAKDDDPACFSDGRLDFYSAAAATTLPQFSQIASLAAGDSLKFDTLKSSRAILTGDAHCPCVFIQFDGETRVLFHPRGQKFALMVRQVMSIPVVVNPALEGPPAAKPGPAGFRICGDAVDQAVHASRIFRLCQGKLIQELNASEEEVKSLTKAIAKKAKGQKMMKDMLECTRMCKNNCGNHAFGNFTTCCTKCVGPEGPHTNDCAAKHEAQMEYTRMAQERKTAGAGTPTCLGCFAFIKK